MYYTFVHKPIMATLVKEETLSCENRDLIVTIFRDDDCVPPYYSTTFILYTPDQETNFSIGHSNKVNWRYVMTQDYDCNEYYDYCRDYNIDIQSDNLTIADNRLSDISTTYKGKLRDLWLRAFQKQFEFFSSL